jgi:hypothetical protein
MFDPTYPPTNADIASAPLRAQFNGLKALIDAIVSVQSAQIDGVTTLPPGDPATVTATVVNGVLGLTFAIPQGSEGPAGGGITQQDLDNAIAGTPNSTNNVSPLSFSVSEPVSQYEGQQIVDKINELIGTLYRY